jgi:hypothetical protein
MAALPKSRITDEILDFLARSPSAEEIINFAPSEEVIAYSRYLLERNRANQLTEDEKLDIEEFSRMNQFMIMLKAKARKNIVEL